MEHRSEALTTLKTARVFVTPRQLLDLAYHKHSKTVHF
jgi:hypothetical protein